MNTQAQLFYEDIFDVVRAAVQAIGGAKSVATRLWPHMPLAEAHHKLLNSLNRERPEKLCIEELVAVLRMAREVGFHQAKHWIDDAAGYEPSAPMDPKVERDRLAEEFALLRQAIQKAERTMERLVVEPPVRAVK